MSSSEPSAARRYKDVLAELTGQAGQVRAADQARAVELREQLVALDDDMVRAGTRARLTGAVVQLGWERALELLWAEQWLKLRMRPDPDTGADPKRLDEYDAEVAARVEALQAVVRRRWYGRR